MATQAWTRPCEKASGVEEGPLLQASRGCHASSDAPDGVPPKTPHLLVVSAGAVPHGEERLVPRPRIHVHGHAALAPVGAKVLRRYVVHSIEAWAVVVVYVCGGLLA